MVDTVTGTKCKLCGKTDLPIKSSGFCSRCEDVMERKRLRSKNKGNSWHHPFSFL